MACSARRTCAGLFVLACLLFACLPNAFAFPAFARKYGLPCSACHEAWPMLNIFGQTFKDRGYQLMNDRDSPIWQNPSYWPVAFRITPHWHRESTDKVAIDNPDGSMREAKLMTHGFDITGMDILSGGTLFNNISFLLVPSIDSTAESIGVESAWVRFDNLLKSPWLNIKMGKMELDNIISEKRIMNLSSLGGAYQLYHFIPFGDSNFFAQIGDNQLGMEWLGHSENDRTRVSASLISSNDGTPGLPAGNSYSTFITASQAFNAGYEGGLDRVGAYYFGGEAPTYFLTSGGVPIPGAGRGNAGFHREGVYGLVYVKKLDFQLYYQHGWDSRYFATSTAGNAPLPPGARPAIWNGGFLETHYVFNPQLVAIQRSEFVRMSQQAIPGTPAHQSDLDVYTFGLRWYPIMFSRAGLALHGEYALEHNLGASPLTFTGVNSSSVFLGLDFDF